MSQSTTAKMIAALNDQFRHGDRTLGEYHSTARVANLPPDQLRALTQAIAAFDEFTEDNDPYGEHDLGIVELNGDRYLWKIDYYDRNLEFCSSDPADPRLTKRIMTIMLSSEY